MVSYHGFFFLSFHFKKSVDKTKFLLSGISPFNLKVLLFRNPNQRAINCLYVTILRGNYKKQTGFKFPGGLKTHYSWSGQPF